MRHTLLFLIILSVGLETNGMNFVYSLQRSAPRIFQFANSGNSFSTTTFLTNDFARTHEKKDINAFGGLLDLIFKHKNNFLRVRAALARISFTDSHNETKSRTQLDDLYFEAIFHKKISNNTSLFLHEIFVAPTHKNTLLYEVQFGFTNFSLGSQMSIFHTLTIENLEFTFIGFFRHIFFLPRTLDLPINKQNFVIKKYDFNMGNLINILVALKIGWSTNSIEIGCVPEFLFGASIDPNVKLLIKALNVIRGGYYATYTNKFKIKKYNSEINLGFAYDPFYKPKNLSFKYILISWIAFNIEF